MHLYDWIAGLQHAYNKCRSLFNILCQGKEFSLNLPDNFIDNMIDTTYGYSWVNLVNTVESKALMRHLMSNLDGNSPYKRGHH